MIKKIIILSLFVNIWFAAYSQKINFAKENERNIVKQQILDTYGRKYPVKSANTIKGYLETQLVNGSWPDIDYKSKRSASWPTVGHLKRSWYLSQAYVDSSHVYFKKEKVKSAIFKSIDFWAANNFEPKNFPGQVIYPQENILLTYLTLEKVETVPEEYIQKTQWIIDKMFKPGAGTGSNKVWFAGIQTLKGLFYKDDALLKRSANDIWSVIKFTEKEGIQRDWVFHQHGNQPQFGNYGFNFNNSIKKWIRVFNNSSYVIKGKQLDLYRNLLLNGEAWSMWNNSMDYNLLGRQNNKGEARSRGEAIEERIDFLKTFDKEYADTYDQHYGFPNKLIGFKSFWRSDLAICRRADWYASIKMSSKRIVSGESINFQNVMGLHQSDGVLFLQQNGKEYEDIGAIWDWKRLPGTTSDQGLTKLAHLEYKKPTATNTFAGSLSKGSLGMASMIYKRNKLKAKKSWFFDEDVIVCLGSDISGTSKGDVVTSIQQSFLKGEVLDHKGKKINKKTTLSSEDWVYHDNVAYQVLNKTSVSIKAVKGNWINTAPALGEDKEVQGTVFSCLMNHGKSPLNKSYAYFIYPNTKFKKVKNKIKKRPLILSNSDELHAIQINDRIYASFFKAGELKLKKGKTIKVDAPCLLLIEGDSLTVTDPNHTIAELNVWVGDEKMTVSLPSGIEKGKQIELKIK